jgi:putative transposase
MDLGERASGFRF